MDSSNDTFKSAIFDGSDEQQKRKTFDTAADAFNNININDEFEEEEYHRQTRKRLIIISISSIILVLLIVGAILGLVVPMHKNDTSSSFTERDKNSIRKVCNATLYPDSCYSSIYSLKMSSSENPGPDPDPDSPEDIFMLSLQVTSNELVRLKSFFSKKNDENDPITRKALDSCKSLIQDAMDHVHMSISSWQLEKVDKFTIYYVVSDIRTWLSTAITDQQTCMDGLIEFKNISLSLQKEIKSDMQNGTEFTSNSLAIISNMYGNIQGFEFPVNRKLAQVDETRLTMRPNVTVARDRSGDYRTITEAVNAMPKRSKERFFIYVKEGEYEEQVVVDSDSWNLMIYGDGMNKTIVSGSLNFADGVATYSSGTFIAEGRGFIARDMGFRNTAGPKKLQAVAVRSSSDRSIFHRCFIDAYQDTLYSHTNRQFYRDCLITGTIDFIFGNSAAIFQNCTIQPRQPGSGQYNIVTAQSKSDPNQNTGFSIQESIISPFDDLTAQTFLGRPWNNYSTTIFMKTEIQGIIDPAGWSPWEPDIEAPDTIFYAEYKNTGPGSVVDERVMWPGYRPNITEEEAGKFFVEPFIQGSKWLINVEYDSHL
ncbi:hypothetical protein BUALT_Bualt09G0046800 [Buddleja alternifolia]|uniref:Pectinesterase n=1 Tax=Buddleja alternifolia TaxID=168488 RepID=A0AAV6X4F5_9LAMI|nr:hypothetical protein BUALT_Bualt09G0046800 [Buddleja alternifolia]